MSLSYKKDLIPIARQLRHEATKQERHLWYDFLRTYPVRFQRQKTIDTFIVDFYCHEAKLVIELDGSQHYSDSSLYYDAWRSTVLERYGLYILRFTNIEIDRSFQAVCEKIDMEVQKRKRLPL